MDADLVEMVLQLALGVLALSNTLAEGQVGGIHLLALVIACLLQNAVNVGPQIGRVLALPLCIVNVLMGKVLPLFWSCGAGR